jgi:hypothetical protein
MVAARRTARDPFKMIRCNRPLPFIFLASLLSESIILAQSPLPSRPSFDAFEVATIKQAAPDDSKAGRYMRMQSAHRFQAKNYSAEGLIAAAYNLTPRAISGGPAWMKTDRFEIVGASPGELRPTYDDQMAMVRKLLADRFNLLPSRKESVRYLRTYGFNERPEAHSQRGTP